MALIVAGLFVQGCGTTIPVRVDESLNNDRIFNLEQVNSRLHESTAIINCTHGLSYAAYDATVDRDTTRFTMMETRLRYSIATREVLSIEWRDHVGGTIAGACLGTLSGVGVAVVLRLSTKAVEGAGTLWPLLGAIGLGTVSGAVIGGIGGNTHTFYFELDRTTRSDTTRAQTGAP